MQDSHEFVRRSFEKLFTVFIFALVLALYPFTGDPTRDIKELLLAWGACLLGGGWLFAAWWSRIPLRRGGVFALPMATFLGLYGVASLAGAYHVIGFITTANFVTLAALYFLASQVFVTPEAVVRLLKALTAASFVASLYGFLQAGGFDPVPWSAADKATDVYLGLPSSYGNPNFAAHVMVLTLPMAIFLFLRQRHWFWAVAAAAIAVHLGMTGQRAGYIALAGAGALAAIAWFVLRTQRKPLRAAAASLVLWVALGAAGVAAGMGLLSIRTGSPLPLDTSLHIRYWSYVSAVDMLKDAPLLGHGPGAYALTYHKYWTQLEKEWFVQENRKNRHVHNDLMEIAIDAGVPAAALYLLMLLLGMGYGIAWAARARPEERWLGLLFAALFAGFLLDGLFGFNLRVPVSAGYLFILMGAMEGMLSRPGAAQEQRRWRWTSTAAVAGLTVVALAQSVVFASEIRLFLAQKALQNNDMDTAREHLAVGESLAPWNAMFAMHRARVTFAKRDLDGAIAEIDRLFTIDPNYFPARLTQARFHVLLAQRTLAKSPTDIELPLQQLQRASREAREALAVCGAHPGAENLLARAAVSTAIAITTSDKEGGPKRARPHWEEAEKHFEVALKGPQPEDRGDMFRLQAQVKLALGKPLEAEQAYARAAKENPADTATWGQFLAFANGNKRYERIRNTLVAAIGGLTAQPEPRADVLALVRLCLANVQENGYNDLDHALEEYREAAKINPLSPEVWTNYARFAYQYEHAETLKQSVLDAHAQLKQGGKEIPAQLIVAYAALQPAANAKALDDASAVLLAQVRAHAPEAKLSAAQTYEWTARLILDKLQLAPAQEQCVPRLNLGIVFLQFKEYQRADALFAGALGCLPKELEGTHAAMWSEALLELDRGAEAVNLLAPLRAAKPDDFDVRHAFARALAKAGRLPEARAEYTALLAEPGLGSAGRPVLQQELDALN